ncbi:MAG: DUF4337 domain-containing protein [Burkholderiaceae bacterium]
MSEEAFEVRGAHEDHLEHAAESGGHDPFSGRIAMTTALLATLGAMFGYMAGLTQADASLYKSTAAIRTTEASDQWNYYQAKGNKQNLAELGVALGAADQKPKFASDVERYGREKDEIKAEAQRLTEESRKMDRLSEESMHVHHRWAQATTLLQISIAMAAIALLTRKTWLQYLVYAFAGLGGVLGALAVASI